eukprot:CAMPEP_0184671942 /NCGR_PEP_ID=MMETSP0308-20130426/85803_1 /TAXON_ID=38269 /ORGANISM="Gloeochaete witrockiana, Strain SAG 46.84" /LENGTH=1318 /DNA_ID=CAMNT_0027119169 /DNA_START=75 /DNA_END=4028 /DNA_ORIENTATION=-
MADPSRDANHMLMMYISDFLSKRNLTKTAATFLQEANLNPAVAASENLPAGAPSGFLFEWWTVFWDIYVSQHKGQHRTLSQTHGSHTQPQTPQHSSISQGERQPSGMQGMYGNKGSSSDLGGMQRAPSFSGSLRSMTGEDGPGQTGPMLPLAVRSMDEHSLMNGRMDGGGMGGPLGPQRTQSGQHGGGPPGKLQGPGSMEKLPSAGSGHPPVQLPPPPPLIGRTPSMSNSGRKSTGGQDSEPPSPSQVPSSPMTVASAADAETAALQHAMNMKMMPHGPAGMAMSMGPHAVMMVHPNHPQMAPSMYEASGPTLNPTSPSFMAASSRYPPGAPVPQMMARMGMPGQPGQGSPQVPAMMMRQPQHYIASAMPGQPPSMQGWAYQTSPMHMPQGMQPSSPGQSGELPHPNQRSPYYNLPPDVLAAQRKSEGGTPPSSSSSSKPKMKTPSGSSGGPLQGGPSPGSGPNNPSSNSAPGSQGGGGGGWGTPGGGGGPNMGSPPSTPVNLPMSEGFYQPGAGGMMPGPGPNGGRPMPPQGMMPSGAGLPYGQDPKMIYKASWAPNQHPMTAAQMQSLSQHHLGRPQPPVIMGVLTPEQQAFMHRHQQLLMQGKGAGMVMGMGMPGPSPSTTPTGPGPGSGTMMGMLPSGARMPLPNHMMRPSKDMGGGPGGGPGEGPSGPSSNNNPSGHHPLSPPDGSSPDMPSSMPPLNMSPSQQQQQQHMMMMQQRHASANASSLQNSSPPHPTPSGPGPGPRGAGPAGGGNELMSPTGSSGQSTADDDQPPHHLRPSNAEDPVGKGRANSKSTPPNRKRKPSPNVLAAGGSSSDSQGLSSIGGPLDQHSSQQAPSALSSGTAPPSSSSSSQIHHHPPTNMYLLDSPHQHSSSASSASSSSLDNGGPSGPSHTMPNHVSPPSAIINPTPNGGPSLHSIHPSSSSSTPQTHVGPNSHPPSLSSQRSEVKDGPNGNSNSTGPPSALSEDTFLDGVDDFLSGEYNSSDHNYSSSANDEPTSPIVDLKEIATLSGHSNKVTCLSFSHDGHLLASGGNDKKVLTWNTTTFGISGSFEGHTGNISDVRFTSGTSNLLASSSFDKTVKLWSCEDSVRGNGSNNTASGEGAGGGGGRCMQTLQGHSASVFSVDFHPTQHEVLCSSDADGEIRLWNLMSPHSASSTVTFQGGKKQCRFQPGQSSPVLAAALDNVVNIFDIRTSERVTQLTGHQRPVHSLAWNDTGDLLVSGSEDSVRVWLYSTGRLLQAFTSHGNKLQSCSFHPAARSLVVIGSYQTIDLWYFGENRSVSHNAHDGLVAGLAHSVCMGLTASASHDQKIKLW